MTRLLAAVLLLALAAGCHDPNKMEPDDHAAQAEGKTAALDGLPPDACPYHPNNSVSARKSEYWKKGWADGFRTMTKAAAKATAR